MNKTIKASLASSVAALMLQAINLFTISLSFKGKALLSSATLIISPALAITAFILAVTSLKGVASKKWPIVALIVSIVINLLTTLPILIALIYIFFNGLPLPNQ